jgi:rod shape-determining protein MreC
MESFFSRFKNALVLIAILLAQAIALAVQVRRPADPQKPDSTQVRLLRLWTLSVFTPFERLSTGTGHGLRYAWSNYVDLRHVRQQNQALRNEVADLRLQRAALAEDALEGQRLQSLLRFSRNYVSKTVAAHVIGTSGSDQSRVLILDKGWHDGLKPDMPVITPDGIVGKLRDVFPTTSQLLLLNDATAGAGVVLQSTRIRAIVHGNAVGRVQITNLTPDARIKPGETILTSGGDQVFPRGLPVGTIESIAPDPEHQPYTAITLHTAANLNQLDDVLIITGTAPSLDPAVQQQLAQEAAARASEISAERLPSLHPDQPIPDPGKSDPSKPSDPNAGPAALPPPDNAPDLVPRPKPALHPDRYTPGSAPPATDLTPGAPNPTPPRN